MPGFDGTGPEGMGAMTGGARGRCYARGRALLGRGSGYGYGRGRGRVGRAAGAPGWFRPAPVPSWMPVYSEEQELEALRNRAAALKDELQDIESRVKGMESQGKVP